MVEREQQDSKLLEWAVNQGNLREVILKNQQNQQHTICIFRANEHYYDILKQINQIENYVINLGEQYQDINHIILKHKDKRGTYVGIKAPEFSIDIENSQRSFRAIQTVQDIILYDPIIVYRFSAVAVFDLDKQFAVNYDIYLPNGETVHRFDIICSKEFLIADLMDKEIRNKQLEALGIKKEINNRWRTYHPTPDPQEVPPRHTGCH